MRSDDLFFKKGGGMTLFSLHHHSNFLRLLPPALWRDPGHCAGGRRGETERIAHPGESELLCGVRVLHTHMDTHTQHKHTPCLCAPLKINLKCGRWLIETLFRSGLFCFWHESISLLTRGPLRPPVFISLQWLKEDRTWQSLLRLHPPFLLSLS